MQEKLTTGRLQQHAVTSEKATNKNRVLLENELFIETDTKNIKLGDGTTKYNDLDYLIKPKENEQNIKDLQTKTNSLYNPNLLIDPGFKTWLEGVSILFGASTNYLATMWRGSYNSGDTGQNIVSMLGSNGGLKSVTTVAFPTATYHNTSLTYSTSTLPPSINGHIVTVSYRIRKLTETTEMCSLSYMTILKDVADQITTEFKEFSVTFAINLDNPYDISFAYKRLNIGDGFEIEWIKLELGDTATPYVEETYAEAISRVNPYLQVFRYIPTVSLGTLGCRYSLNMPMNTTPTVHPTTAKAYIDNVEIGSVEVSVFKYKDSPRGIYHLNALSSTPYQPGSIIVPEIGGFFTLDARPY